MQCQLRASASITDGCASVANGGSGTAEVWVRLRPKTTGATADVNLSQGEVKQSGTLHSWLGERARACGLRASGCWAAMTTETVNELTWHSKAAKTNLQHTASERMFSGFEFKHSNVHGELTWWQADRRGAACSMGHPFPS